MSFPGIDHIVLAVHDLEAARQRFAALGFTLTPPALHPFGTGNSLVQLQHSFIELLAVVEPERIPEHADGRFSFAAFNRDFLAHRQGLSMLVLRSEDTKADNAAWAERGLSTFEPTFFARKAKQPDGSEAEVSFTIAFATDPALPGAAFFVCQQHAPQYFWKPDYQVHANGAREIVETTMIAEDPKALRPFVEKVFGPEMVHTEGEGISADMGPNVHDGRGREAAFEVLSPAALPHRFLNPRVIESAQGPYFLAASITVEDMGVTDSLLRESGIAFTRREDALEVAPEEAFGLLLEFRPALD